MGCSEEGKSFKSEKSSPSPPATEQTNVHVYPDWAAMQAYYGPGVAMPPYYNPTAASGQPPPPYVWGPQPMMSPYGDPYTAIYAHGGVYAHPAILLGTPTHGQGTSSSTLSEPPVAIALSIGTPIKSSGNADSGLMKKLKGFDGLAMSIGNTNVNAKIEGSAENKSQRTETGSSSNRSDENIEEVDKNKRKRSLEKSVADGEDEQVESKAPLSVLETPITPANAAKGHVMVTVSPSVPAALELLNPEIDVNANATTMSSSNTALSSELWIQNERELKREKRKQSNRDSAKRSRLRRQVVAEELGRKVASLTAEKFALKLEINQLVENSNKLRFENAALLEKFKSLSSEVDNKNAVDRTTNLLSRVNNPDPVSRSFEEGTDVGEKRSKSKGSKFHQLLIASPRADAVAAS